jgi:hypothetical protein
METLCFQLNNFANQCRQKGEEVQVVADKKAFGHDWKLYVYPFGSEGSGRGGEDHVSFTLICTSPLSSPIYVRFTIAVGSLVRCKRANDCGMSGHAFGGAGAPIKNVGIKNYAPRTMVLDPSRGLLDETGTLHVTVRLCFASENMGWSPPEIKKEDSSNHVLAKILHDPRWTDVSFSVAGQTFAAHKSILAVTAPALLLEMKDPSDEEDAVIELTGINPDTFENLISFCYTNQLTTTTGCSSFEEGKDLLRAADRFECVPLKLFVESKIVEDFLHSSNAADCLLLAKSHSCAYLEEAATCVVTLVPDRVFATTEWLNVQQDGELMTKLLRAIIDPPPPIAELRKRLAEDGRDIDGSRETLVKRLQSSSDE